MCIMNAMDILVSLMRIGLHGICIGVPVAADALMFLGTATAIILATDSERQLRR